ncbi:MAG: efflux RND transporter periplasmic adaptor subunit [bacterium]
MDKIKIKSKSIFKKKRFWLIAVAVLLVGGYFIFRPSNNAANTVTDRASYIDLKQTVLATGQVTSKTDLNLSFNSSGVVRRLNVSVGDQVKTGQVLATLDQGQAQAILTQSRGALAAAQARLAQTLAGASTEEIKLAQVNLDQTKLTQATLVSNAYHNLLNSTPEAVPDGGGTTSYTAPTISGSYNGDKEGVIKINVYYTGGGASFSVSGLVSGSGIVSTNISQPIGDSGLSIKFPASYSVANWSISIPNKNSSVYLTNYNAYQAALSQQQLAVSQQEAQLAIKQSSARTADIDLARADIVSAQGQVESAQAKYNDTVITAPADGTITRVDLKLGELASAQKEAMVLQDVSNIYLESNINEANISSISLGMPIDITYDAFGTDKIFHGTVSQIDPSSTLISGVVNYKVTANIEATKDLRPGMTANMTIKVKEKDHVLAVPDRAVLIDSTTNKKTVRVVNNTKTKTFTEVPVTTGLEGDGGIVEITSGISEGDEFVVLIKK